MQWAYVRLVRFRLAQVRSLRSSLIQLVSLSTHTMSVCCLVKHLYSFAANTHGSILPDILQKQHNEFEIGRSSNVKWQKSEKKSIKLLTFEYFVYFVWWKLTSKKLSFIPFTWAERQHQFMLHRRNKKKIEWKLFNDKLHDFIRITTHLHKFFSTPRPSRTFIICFSLTFSFHFVFFSFRFSLKVQTQEEHNRNAATNEMKRITEYEKGKCHCSFHRITTFHTLGKAFRFMLPSFSYQQRHFNFFILSFKNDDDNKQTNT